MNGCFSVSMCVVNQLALDFHGNMTRIVNSIELARKAGARYRLGPELEVCGYGCEDHFNELDTVNECWKTLATILSKTTNNEGCGDIVCDIGMPVRFSGALYNCRVLIHNGRVLLIRPKMVLADGGLHRESRWFTAWPRAKHVVPFRLPHVVLEGYPDSEPTVPFGDALLRFADNECDVVVGLETCEELWIGIPPHFQMYAAGADMVLNASASHHELRKLHKRVQLVEMASNSGGSGGFYVYTNLRGCDAGRICYDGGAMAAVAGKLVFLGKQFSLDEVEVNTVSVDIRSIQSRRIGNKSFGLAAATATAATGSELYPIVDVSFEACESARRTNLDTFGAILGTSTPRIDPVFLSPEEEISLGPSLWLWDQLRRANMSGYFLCLSGGLDSASVACIVLSMCHQIHQSIAQGSKHVLETCSKLLNVSESDIEKFQLRDFCSRMLHTCCLPSEHSTSMETISRASRLAAAIGSHHLSADIAPVVSSMLEVAQKSLNLTEPPRFTVHGGSKSESLALQNVQARSRMVLAYLFAQLLPGKLDPTGGKGLLILGTSNLDECLYGYYTKYDCSSADLNPIGSISKADLRLFVAYFANTFSKKYLDAEHAKQLQDVLLEILQAPPTAELMPLGDAGRIEQTDEADMGLTYNMLSLFGRLRKINNCGPISMLQTLIDGAWRQIRADLPADCVDSESGEAKPPLAKFLYEKVKLFTCTYAKNRHKATTLPPAYHTEAYSADDNR